MFYRELAPGRDLHDKVHCFWFLEHDPGPDAPPEKILPDGRTELIFNLGAPYRRGGAARSPAQPRCFAVGQIRRSIEIVASGRALLVGVRLQPTALRQLVDAPMSELTDRSVGLDQLGLAGLERLDERLREARGWRERLALLEAVLARRLARRGTRASDAAREIRETHGAVDLATVARSVGWSTRTLDRRFADEVGLPPKLFARQVRLQRALQLLSRGPRLPLAEIALASGCYDQAHLNREFRTLVGESPTSFLRAPHQLSRQFAGLAGSV